MCRVWRPAATVAVRPLPAPTPVLPVKVPVNDTRQSKRFPGSRRLVARLWRLKATRAPAVGAVEADHAGCRSSASCRRGPRRYTCSCVHGNGTNDSSTDSRRHRCHTSAGGTRRAPGCAQSPLSRITIIVCFIVPCLAFKAATRTLVMSVGTVIVRPIPTFSRPFERVVT